jgi:hypothetical protein
MSESIATDQAAKAETPKTETAQAETPKTEPVKSEAASGDIKTETPADRPVESIASTIRTRFAARPRASRYAVLAASITIAAALGSVAGALAGSALMRPAPEISAAPTMNANALSKTLAQLSADIASLRAAVDASGRTTNAQLSKITERVERAEKAQAEPAQKIARLSEAVERLERKPAPAPTDVTGSIVEKQEARPPIVEGWVIRDIFDGRAMVQSSRHGIYEVGPGAPLPGVGRVEAIRRQDGRWVVVTPKGLIVSSR